MAKVVTHMCMSLDGFVAQPDDDPAELFEWYWGGDVVVPSATPELLNGIRTALALSFILLVSSELIVAREGLGYLIGFLGANGSYDAMFAVVLTVAFLGFAADRVYLMIMQRVLRWQA